MHVRNLGDSASRPATPVPVGRRILRLPGLARLPRSPSLLLLPAARPNGARSARSARRSPIALCLLERYEVAPFFPCAPLPPQTSHLATMTAGHRSLTIGH